MEKIINIRLAGQIVPIEESAYNQLKTYLDGLRTYLHTQEGGDEVFSDIESRVAELLMAQIRSGSPAIHAQHVAAVEKQLGSVEDFRAAEHGESIREEVEQDRRDAPARRRFTRDANDKIGGGVCAGLAAYFNVDPALIRIIFGVLGLAGWGTGILLYVFLWFAVPQSAQHPYHGRRLYRSNEDRWIGGVCGGLATYFDREPWFFRLVLAIPLLFGAGFLRKFDFLLYDFTFVVGSLSSAAVLIYILLWIALPMAYTDFQKMELRGENIDLHTIRNNVFSDLKNRSQSFAQEAREAAERLSGPARTVFSPRPRRTRPFLKRVLRFIFFAITTFVAVLLFVLLIGYFFGDFSKMANFYLFETPKQKILGFSTAVLLLGMPLMSALTTLLSGTTPIPAGVRLAQRTFNILWFCGFLSLLGLIALLGRSFQSGGAIREVLPVQVADSNALLVQTVGRPVRYRNTISGLQGSIQGFDIDEDSLRLAWTSLRVTPSPDSLYHAVIVRSSRGPSREDAFRRATSIFYPASKGAQQANVLRLPAGYVVPQNDYFRGQQVAVELQVPVGRTVRFDRSLQNTLPDNAFLNTEMRYSNGHLRYRERRQILPQTSVTYRMETDGILHRADRTPGEISLPGVQPDDEEQEESED